MTTTIKKQCITILLLSFLIHTNAQNRAQDHNSSRSNKTVNTVQSADDWNSSRSNKSPQLTQSDDWTFGINSGASFAARSNENSLFRGNGMATKMFGRYCFGNIGLGFSSGIVPGSINNNALNEFIIERKFQQSQIAKSNPFNTYFLFGPSFRYGNRVIVNAEMQGGMFINNPGGVTIAQQGALRPLYRFEGAGKNLFPGFSGSISLAYPINNSTRFFINTDYLQSKSSIRLFDPQRGIDVAIEQDRHVKLFTLGVGITKSFGSKRGAASGMASGKKHVGNVKYENISITEDAATGERIIVATRQHAINTKGTGANNGRMMNNESCGPVIQKIGNPDGTVNEMTFACPNDAAKYNERISMKTTVPKQTQGTTFGEKVNAGLHAAGCALSQRASLKGVISGSVNWSGGAISSSGIVTNQDAVSSVSNLAGSGGGAAAASYAATGRMAQPSSPQGVVANIYAREAGSGMATGRRSREAGSGQATARRQYEPVFYEGETDTCTGCAVTVKLIGHELTHTVQQAQGQLKGNPLYNSNGQQGINPMHEQNKMSLLSGEDDDCDGIIGLDVYLVDVNIGAVAATTKTGACGNFFFANVPAATYVVKIKGGFSKTKNYDVNINSETKKDMAGEIVAANDHWAVQISSESDNSNQKAGVSTSRSNIRNRNITIIEADLDSDGEFESTKVLMEFSDGTTKDVTASSRINYANGTKKVTVRGWNPEKKQVNTGSGNTITEYTINIDGNTSVLLTSLYENGTKKETQVLSIVNHHPDIIQFMVPVDDLDVSSEAQPGVKIKTKSNIKNLPAAIGDANNDGISDILIGNSYSWGAGNDMGMNNGSSGPGISSGASLLGGALPGGAVISAFAMPGEPIPGIDVKLGKNPGGQGLQTTTSNANGEFEFTNMKKGSYTISAALNYYIDDETVVTIADEDDDNDGLADRKGWDGTVKGGAVANDAPQGKGINEKGIKKSGGSNEDIEGKKSIVNTTKRNTKDFLVSLDELDKLLATDKNASADVVNTVKENSRAVRSSITQLENSLQNIGLLARTANTADTNFAILLGSINKLGEGYSSISNVLKTRHDTVKNSVGNIR